jgi:hypothetical protein
MHILLIELKKTNILDLSACAKCQSMSDTGGPVMIRIIKNMNRIIVRVLFMPFIILVFKTVMVKKGDGAYCLLTFPVS